MKRRTGSKNILLGISGGIAAYKMPDMVHGWVKAGCEVEIILTEAAENFVSPLVLSTLTGKRVWLERDFLSAEQGWKIPHIALTDWADVFVVAPCTANVLRVCAQGDGSTLLGASLLACAKPKLFFPAMNCNMLENGATRDNIRIIREMGCEVIEPESGILACGYEGKGRLPSEAVINACIERALTSKKDLCGKKVLVTAGPTHEFIDPVRYIGNPSSGKMGYAVARAAYRRGADAVLVSGPSNLEPPYGVRLVPVISADEMYEACMAEAPDSDIVVKAAAVGDFRAAKTSVQKIKRGDADKFTLELVQNRDIAAALGREKREGQIIVGFAAETENLESNALGKMRSKKLDMIAVNDVSADDAGFAAETNKIVLLDSGGGREEISGTKDEVAEAILDRAAAFPRESE